MNTSVWKNQERIHDFWLYQNTSWSFLSNSRRRGEREGNNKCALFTQQSLAFFFSVFGDMRNTHTARHTRHKFCWLRLKLTQKQLLSIWLIWTRFGEGREAQSHLAKRSNDEKKQCFKTIARLGDLPRKEVKTNRSPHLWETLNWLIPSNVSVAYY